MQAIPLEPSADQLRDMTRACTEFVRGQLEGLAELPSADLSDAPSLVASFREPAPESGVPMAQVLTRLGPAVQCSLNTAGPGYLAYIPGGGLPTAALAAYLAGSVNRYVGVAGTAPALVEIEACAVRWLASIIGYPQTARGTLTSGGSIANFTALVTARTAMLPEDFLRGTIYLSGQTHASVLKAARLAGFPARAIRIVPADDRLRMDAVALAEQVRADRAKGDMPFLVIANAGTTNTGAIDPIPAICDVAAQERLWVHADGAYGGLFCLADPALLPGLSRCDSVTVDPHKAMFLPYGVGSVLVRDGEALRRAHQVHAEYLRDFDEEQESISFTDLSPELSRPFRGLQLWLPVQVHGLAAFREALREKLALARHAADRIRSMEEFELVDEPQLSIVPFRVRGFDDAAQSRVLERTNARGRAFLSSTMVHGRAILRICVVSFRTHQDRIDQAIEDLRQEARALRADR